MPLVSFIPPENIWKSLDFLCFKGYRKRPVTWNGLINLNYFTIVQTFWSQCLWWKRLCKHSYPSLLYNRSHFFQRMWILSDAVIEPFIEIPSCRKVLWIQLCSSVHASLTLFSEDWHFIFFLIIYMKLGLNKHLKLTKPFFKKNSLFTPNRVILGHKINIFELFSKSVH